MDFSFLKWFELEKEINVNRNTDGVYSTGGINSEYIH